MTDVDQCYLKMIKHFNYYLRMIKFLRNAIVARDDNCENIEKSLLRNLRKLLILLIKKY